MGTSLIVYIERSTALVPVSPVRTHYSAGWGKEHFLAWKARAKLALAEKTIREYNFYVRQIRREVRAIHDLFGEAQFTLIDSPHIAVRQDPRLVPAHLRDKGPPAPPTSRAELRAEARKNRVDVRVLWDRFPPSTPDEFRQMQKDLAAYKPKLSPEAKVAADPLKDFLTAQAKADAKSTGAKWQSFMTDTEWKARQTTAFRNLQALVADLDLGL